MYPVVVAGPRMFREVVCARLREERNLLVLGDVSSPDMIPKLAAKAQSSAVCVVELRGDGSDRAALVSLQEVPVSGPMRLASHAGALTVSKSSPIGDLLGAIHAAIRGPVLRYAHPEGTGLPSAVRLLSAREREVFDLVVQGKSNKEMSAELRRSIKTIETHRSNINRKLEVHSPAELLRFAWRHGLAKMPGEAAVPPASRERSPSSAVP